jgi:non-specific serine/threonine protein kinase/serine/threonine-protein kinase
VESERWENVERLYHLALQQEAAERAAFLNKACGGDWSLELEIRSLLAQTELASAFLEQPALDVAARALAQSAAAHQGAGSKARSLPSAIGRYRILGVLGEGGMGSVYEAEQEEPRRTVALKIIRSDLVTPERLWRFRLESEALGRLQHPGIAQIHEASTAETPMGPQPYFAMELIRGLPLEQYATENHLNTRERLRLMSRVCEAVHHTHQRGLIHRDLKPTNILVNAAAQPKILDFGVARLIEGDAQDSNHTRSGQLLGTLPYMSPEQVLGDSVEVDTRSDVYSLGVILYQLLSGRLPHDVGRRPLHEAVRVIRDEDPASLSTISPTYRGDIETIVSKALEKDKTRRYASAADMAGDIQRYLDDQPISARAPSAAYQLGKFRAAEPRAGGGRCCGVSGVDIRTCREHMGSCPRQPGERDSLRGARPGSSR